MNIEKEPFFKNSDSAEKELDDILFNDEHNKVGINSEDNRETRMKAFREFFNNKLVENKKKYTDLMAVADTEKENNEQLQKYFREITKDQVRKEFESSKDKLTGLMDIESLKKRYDLEARMHKNSSNENEVMVVVFLDVDNFKNVNDFGHDKHQGGDEVLKQIGSKLKNMLRKIDVASRRGGDEFMLIFNHVNKNEVENLLTRVQNKLCTITYQDENNKPKNIGISIGARTISQNIYKMPSFDEVNGKADEAMFLAKEDKDSSKNIKIMDIDEKIPEELKTKEYYQEMELKRQIRPNEKTYNISPELAEERKYYCKKIGDIDFDVVEIEKKQKKDIKLETSNS